SIDDFQTLPKRGRVGLLDRLQRFYVRRADRIVVPSGYLAGLVKGWGADPARIRVVHNAVDVERFALDTPASTARAQLGLDGRVLLSIARLAPWKGLSHVIRTLLDPRVPADLHLVHCGEGPEQGALQGLAVELGLAGRV